MENNFFVRLVLGLFRIGTERIIRASDFVVRFLGFF